MILSGQSIRKLCLIHGMISPFSERAVINGKSYGLSTAGYDIRIAERHIIVNGHFQLASSVERFSMPDNVIARVCDKSSWARVGLSVFNTVIEAGWCGYLTLELKNNYHSGALVIPADEPIAQIIFEMTDEPCERPYQGKYQNQEAGPQKARYE